MRTAFRSARWIWILVLAAIPIRVSAESARSAEVIREITIDFNFSGKSNRVVLTRSDDEGSYVDLTIYPGTEAKKPASAPSFVKRRLASGHLHEMTAKGNGSLRVESRCGGCSNDDTTVFTIVYRAGEFLVGGYTRSWELRDGSAGSCDVNYLTGKGVVSKGLPERAKPIKTVFRPIRLADWSDEKVPKACRP
jgi:hypothetical protein